MNPPTKFQNMRNNRYSADMRKEGKAGAAQDLTPAVPTMEIDGAKYREVPSAGCRDCAFLSGDDCAMPLGGFANVVAAFGGDCDERQVHYIRAE